MIRCRFIHNIYHNTGNGHTISVYKTEEELPEQAKTKDNSGEFTAIGFELPESIGVELDLEGEWKNSSYGFQFHVSYYLICMPTTLPGIESYLSSSLVKGIGPVTAGRIVRKFGKKTFHVMDRTPEKLLEIPGITETKLEEILDGYHESSVIRDLMVYMGPLGITPKELMKIKTHFGIAALKIVKEEPYRLCEIKGFGFLKVDPIASKSQNFEPDHPLRVKEAIKYVLQKAEEEGHLYLPGNEIVQKAGRLLNHDLKKNTVPDSVIKDIGNLMIREDKVLVSDAGVVYTRKNFFAEMGAAADLVRLCMQKNMCIRVRHLLDKVQQEEHIQLGKKQIDAVCAAFLNPVSIITGGPGRGKTTIIRIIIRIQEILDKDAMILLCAPTGRASRKMYESTGYPSMTIHKAIGLTGIVEEDGVELDKMPDDLIIVDEFSMVDMYLADKLFGCIKAGSRLVMVGDKDQIESVGPGNVFKEMIESEVIPVTVLDECYRQDEDSLIAMNANKINNNRTDLVYGDCFKFYPANNPTEAAEIIRKLYVQEWKRNNKNLEKIQVLSPLRKDTEAGSDSLNRLLREAVNPKRRGYPEITNGNNVYRQVDKIMQIKNDDEVSNGDIGKVLKIYKKEGKDRMRVDYGEQRIVEYEEGEHWPLSYAYAMSVHKAQGGEYPVIIVPMLKCFYKMLRRNILYTAVTRGTTNVILVGSKAAIAQAIHTNTTDKRNTKFKTRIKLVCDSIRQNEKKSA